jgi:alpha-tubulin suppressor-like RCC1 family protein
MSKLLTFWCLVMVTSLCAQVEVHNIKQIAVGAEFTMALDLSGRVFSWGFNGDGQVGTGVEAGTFVVSPELIETGDKEWDFIAAGAVHGIGIKKDGSLWAWGSNVVNQLGDGTTTSSLTPKRIGQDTDWQMVVCGQAHNLAIKSDGSLWAWGFNSFGQLGNGMQNNAAVPLRIGSDNDWKYISAGGGHSLAIKEDGSLWAWGANFNGQAGTGGAQIIPQATRLGEEKWMAVSTGFEFSAGIREDGTLWTWGFNGNGQLGLGTLLEERSPKQVPFQNEPDIEFRHISCGSAYVHAIDTQGRLWAWGANIEGCLGLGSPVSNFFLPSQVGEDNDWMLVEGAKGLSTGNSVFGFHTMAIKESADVICVAGANYGFQLGDGTSDTKREFECTVLLSTISNVTDLSTTHLVNVYPNPFTDYIEWQLASDAVREYKIIDLNGRLVQTGKSVQGKNRIQTGHLTPGMYYLQLDVDSQNQLIKIIKQ